MKKQSYFLFTLLWLVSCSSYVQRFHQQFDRYEDSFRYGQTDELALYKKNKRSAYSKVTTANQRFISPPIKRHYRSQEDVRKRYKAEDFNDNNSDGSLWVNATNNNRRFLFNQTIQFKRGDIILIQVQGKLKNEITSELKRAFSTPRITNAAPSRPAVTTTPPTSKITRGVSEKDNKIFDVVSSIVVDEINQTHLLIRGRKQILFKNRKRFIEIQALVSRSDIDIDGSLTSNRIIENQIKIIR